MAQIFQRRFILLLKLVVLIAVAFIITAIFAWRTYTGPAVALNMPVEQPIPFSHKHHVGDDGIDCRYCHTSVEQSSFAGIPPLQICMTSPFKVFHV